MCKSHVPSMIAALAALLGAGCAVGPNFKKPAPPEVSGYTAAPPADTIGTPDVVAGQPQRFAAGADISADWWTLFHSAPLNELIDQSAGPGYSDAAGVGG